MKKDVSTKQNFKRTIPLRQGHNVKLFFQSISWNTISGAFHETWNIYDLLFRKIFETQIHIQTQIWENFILLLATNYLLSLLLKYRKVSPTINLLTKNKSPEIRHFVDDSGRFSDNIIYLFLFISNLFIVDSFR